MNDVLSEGEWEEQRVKENAVDAPGDEEAKGTGAVEVVLLVERERSNERIGVGVVGDGVEGKEGMHEEDEGEEKENAKVKSSREE